MQKTQFDLGGRRAIITGGAQGIGRAIADRFLESGAKVCLWDVDTMLEKTAGELQKQHQRTEDDVTFELVDVADAGAVESAATTIAKKWQGIDILCANAGIGGPTATLWEYPVEEWNRVQAINTNGVFHCCRAVVPYMIKQNYGRIINTASIAGKEGNPNASAYSTSKAAVIGMTKSLGKELADYDIAVNCITPVTADTRILDQLSEEFIEYMRSKIPRGRFITVEEIAGTVAWMASEDNGFTTAGVYDLSGGRATY